MKCVKKSHFQLDDYNLFNDHSGEKLQIRIMGICPALKLRNKPEFWSSDEAQECNLHRFI